MSTRLAVVCLLGLLLGALPARADDQASDAQRWNDLRHSLFGDRAIADGAAVLTLQAPYRAEDAALVPIAVISSQPAAIKGLYLVIDGNPSPLAAHFTFGPAADPSDLHLRVRVNAYTYIHAVAELADGRLVMVQRFVKAAGGCSAPAGESEAEALKGIGRMKLRLLTPFAAGKTEQAELLIRHPNFNGMQMDQLTRLYTPARFINAIDVTYGGAKVFHLDTDISMSSDPAITFGFAAKQGGRLQVVAHDSSDAVFTHTFDVPAAGS